VHDDRLTWTWSGDASTPAFSDPTQGGRYQLCIYGRSLALDVAAPAAAACRGATRPCWLPIGGGHRLVDARGGLTSVRMTSAGGRRQVLVRGRGPLLDAPYLPIVAPNGLTVQLQDTSTGRCWGADFAPGDIKRNIAGTTERGSRRDGRVVARLR
jgi:hypothetical protein